MTEQHIRCPECGSRDLKLFPAHGDDQLHGAPAEGAELTYACEACGWRSTQDVEPVNDRPDPQVHSVSDPDTER